MEILKQHIKEGTFSRMYLLCGTETYLIKLYRNKLKNALLSEEDSMNYSYFEGKNVDENQVKGIADTLPFFSERRVILLENTGFFKRASDLAEKLKTIPETTCIVFVESEVDKKTKMYKLVKEKGYISEIDALPEKDLIQWVAIELGKAGKRVKESTVRYLIENVSAQMTVLVNEMEKLIAYTAQREEVTVDDIHAICTLQIQEKLFEMIDAVAVKNQSKALKLYNDLLVLRTKPNAILYNLTKHFERLLHVKQLQEKRAPAAQIASVTGIRPYFIKKYVAQSAKFTEKELQRLMEQCIQTDENIKTGKMSDQVALETLLICTGSNI